MGGAGGMHAGNGRLISIAVALAGSRMENSHKRPSSDPDAIPTKPAEERPTKRHKNKAVRLLNRSTGRLEPLSQAHNQVMLEHALLANEGVPLAMGSMIALQSSVMAMMENYMKGVSSMHKYASEVIQKDRHPASVARDRRCFDEETFVWQSHHQRNGDDGRYVAAGCACSWCRMPDDA